MASTARQSRFLGQCFLTAELIANPAPEYVRLRFAKLAHHEMLGLRELNFPSFTGPKSTSLGLTLTYGREGMWQQFRDAEGLQLAIQIDVEDQR